ncbi:MAG: PAS domain S-box protein, partial [Armatimonadota bacterium]
MRPSLGTQSLHLNVLRPGRCGELSAYSIGRRWALRSGWRGDTTMSDHSSSVAPGDPGVASALLESERRFHAAFANAGTGMCLTAPDGSFLEVNRALCDMLGYSREELASTDFASVTHPDDLDASRECVRCLLAGERSVCRFEKRYLRRDGQVVWGDVSTSLFRDADGQPLYFITQIQDVSDRKDAEMQLRRTERLLSSLIEHAPTPVYANELDSSYRFVNPTWQRLSGFDQNDTVGRRVAELFGPVVAHRFDDDVRSVVETGGPVAVDESGTYLGLTYHFQTVRFGILDDQDNVEAIGSICVDITDRKQMEAALQQSEGRFRAAFEHAALGMTLTGVDGQLIEANEAFGRMVGYSRTDLPSVSFRDLTHPDDINTSREAIQRLLAGESEAEYLEKRYVSRDGETVWAEVSVFLLRDADGVPLHFITHQRDITGRRRTQAALRDSERRFREMAELLPDMVIELDRQLRITYVNLGVSEVLGYTQGDLDAGLNLADVTDADTLDRLKEEFAAALAAGRPLRGDFLARCKNGRSIPVEAHAMAILRSDGELVGYRGVLRDGTERMKAQDAQRLAAVGQLAAGVAHEFNNLLASLMLQ